MRRLASTLSRLIGLTLLLYSARGLFVNLAAVFTGDFQDPPWTTWVVVEVMLVGLAGSAAFLLSFDGPPRWRTTGRRLLGWVGMLICGLLPSQWVIVMAPIAVTGGFALFIRPDAPARRRGRHLITSA
jgi:hypothetical protein